MVDASLFLKSRRSVRDAARGARLIRYRMGAAPCPSVAKDRRRQWASESQEFTIHEKTRFLGKLIVEPHRYRVGFVSLPIHSRVDSERHRVFRDAVNPSVGRTHAFDG